MSTTKSTSKQKTYLFKLPVLQDMGLQWKKGRSDLTSVSERMIWETRCKRYRVVRSKIIYGNLPVVFYAMINKNGFWDILSRHRKKHTAQRACEKDAKKKGLI